jgi:hypothetical protein
MVEPGPLKFAMTTDYRFMQVLSDAQAIDSATSAREVIVESEIYFKMEWLRGKEFVAVPVDNLGFFNDDQLQRLSAAIKFLGVSECLAIATEDWGNAFPQVLCVPSSFEGLSEFNEQLGSTSYLLIPEGQAFAVLCSSSYFNVVAGPRSFVDMAVEGGVDGARDWFRQFAKEWETPKEVQTFLNIAARYESTG